MMRDGLPIFEVANNFQFDKKLSADFLRKYNPRVAKRMLVWDVKEIKSKYSETSTGIIPDVPACSQPGCESSGH